MAKTNENEKMAAYGEDECVASDDEGFLCTRTQGHGGDHVAHAAAGRVVARWPSAPATDEQQKCDGCGKVWRDLSESRFCVECLTFEVHRQGRLLEAAREKAEKVGADKREQAAVRMLEVLVSRPDGLDWNSGKAARLAVKYADDLLAALAKPREET